MCSLLIFIRYPVHHSFSVTSLPPGPRFFCSDFCEIIGVLTLVFFGCVYRVRGQRESVDLTLGIRMVKYTCVWYNRPSVFVVHLVIGLFWFGDHEIPIILTVWWVTVSRYTDTVKDCEDRETGVNF